MRVEGIEEVGREEYNDAEVKQSREEAKGGVGKRQRGLPGRGKR